MAQPIRPAKSDDQFRAESVHKNVCQKSPSKGTKLRRPIRLKHEIGAPCPSRRSTTRSAGFRL